MVILRGVFAVLIGTVVLWVAGALYEFYKPAFIPSPVEYERIYPWFTGVSALVGAAIAVVLFGIWQPREAAERPAKPSPKLQAKTATKAKQTAGAKNSGVKTSTDVPGMPTFDLEELKRSADTPPTEKKKQ